MKDFRPRAKEGQSFHSILQSHAQSVEFDIMMYHHEIPQGWEILPHIQRLEVRYTIYIGYCAYMIMTQW